MAGPASFFMETNHWFEILGSIAVSHLEHVPSEMICSLTAGISPIFFKSLIISVLALYLSRPL